jgi:hypothetical protein
MPWVNKLTWEEPEYENEELPLWRRAELAFFAGKLSRARELRELSQGVESVLNSDYHQLDELVRQGPHHTQELPTSEPVNPGLDFVRRYGGGSH